MLTVAALLRFAEEHLALEPGATLLELRANRRGRCGVERVCCAGIFDASDALVLSDRRVVRRIAVTSTDATRSDMRSELAVEQHDTIVGGVAAYSTLGWFDDPVLSTFVSWPDADLAGLIFHELAHGQASSFRATRRSTKRLRASSSGAACVEWLRAEHDEAQHRTR